MDPQSILNQRLQQSQQNEKTFSDRLKERRGFVQGQENTASPIFERLLEAPNGEARVASTDIINPLRGFTTENTRMIQGAEDDLTRAGATTDSLLGTLIQLSEAEKDRALQERKLSLEEAQSGAVFNPQTGRYEINQNALSADAIKSETELRKEFNALAKESGFKDVQASYEKIKNAGDNAQGDLSLIFAYMKMLDPGSTVREGEFANAENTAGIPGQIRNQYNKALRGERLNKIQREGFKNEAGKIYNQYIDRHNSLVDSYDSLATQYGVNSKRVTGQLGRVKPAPINPNAPGITEQRSIGDNVLDWLTGGFGLAGPRMIADTVTGGNRSAGGFVIESID